MELQLKNIGMIKEANVKLDGLTVIAGENDTGKSTVGKVLYVLIKAKYDGEKSQKKVGFSTFSPNYIFQKVFKYIELKKMAYAHLYIDSVKYYFDNFSKTFISGKTSILNKDKKDIIFIETPLVWNFTDFFRDIALIESQMKIEIDYPYLMKDLNFKLFIKNASNGLDIKEKVTSLMGGEFKKDEMGRYYFDKQGERIELVNTATGIKYFGIFQVLSQNNYLNENTVLVLDEPEVHLHPKWQLEMAKIIVELVKNGVKILVNSHSPYMIEALERYAEKAEVPADFYLAEDGIIDKVEDNNSKTLAKIFHKFSAPYETFNQMDSEILKGG